MDSRLYQAFLKNSPSAEMPAAVPHDDDELYRRAMARQAGVTGNPHAPAPVPGNTANPGGGNWLDDPSRNISLFKAFMDWIGTSGQAKPHIWGDPNANPDNPLIGK